MLFEERELNEWKQDIKEYDSLRKKKDVERVKVQKITHKEMKLKEQVYNPILQLYRDPELEGKKIEKDKTNVSKNVEKFHKYAEKYEKEYDIISLEKRPDIEKPESILKDKKRLVPESQIEYNIITNEALDEIFYKNADKRPKKKNLTLKKIDSTKFKDFNIVTNRYLEGHEDKSVKDSDQEKNECDKKFKDTHDYNCLVGKYYDEKKEEEYQKSREDAAKVHGKDFINRFPPSWKFREKVIIDRTKDIPDEIKMIDEQKKAAKKRFELRYALEEEYRDKDIENQEKKKEKLRNRLHDAKYTEEYKKGFDIITLNPINQKRMEELVNKKPMYSTWDKLVITSHRPDSDQHYHNIINQLNKENQDGDNPIKYYNEGSEENLENNIGLAASTDSKLGGQLISPEEFFKKKNPGKIESRRLPKIESNPVAVSTPIIENTVPTGMPNTNFKNSELGRLSTFESKGPGPSSLETGGKSTVLSRGERKTPSEKSDTGSAAPEKRTPTPVILNEKKENSESFQPRIKTGGFFKSQL